MRALLAALPFFLLPTSCALQPAGDGEPDRPGKSDSGDESAKPSPEIPSVDDRETIEVVSWNVEWFGDDDRGPADDHMQLANVAAAISGINADLFGLVEVVRSTTFYELLEELPGYHGLLVTDPLVDGGASAYSADEQKVALVVRDRFEIEAARVVLEEHSWAFAGRPPLEVELSFREAGERRTLVVIIVHFKAMANWSSYQRRQAAADALEAYLDSEYSWQWVLVIGDLNDDIDESTYRGYESPFADLVADPDYRFTTDALSEAETSTTTKWSATIDHHLATDSLEERFVEGSARVLRLDDAIEDYDGTTSDHFPVLTRYDLR